MFVVDIFFASLRVLFSFVLCERKFFKKGERVLCEFLLLCAYYIHNGDDSIERKTPRATTKIRTALLAERERKEREYDRAFSLFPEGFWGDFRHPFFQKRDEKKRSGTRIMMRVVYLPALSRAKTNERRRSALFFAFSRRRLPLRVSLSLFVRLKLACVRLRSFFCCVLNFLFFRVLNPKT